MLYPQTRHHTFNITVYKLLLAGVFRWLQWAEEYRDGKYDGAYSWALQDPTRVLAEVDGELPNQIAGKPVHGCAFITNLTA